MRYTTQVSIQTLREDDMNTTSEAFSPNDRAIRQAAQDGTLVSKILAKIIASIHGAFLRGEPNIDLIHCAVGPVSDEDVYQIRSQLKKRYGDGITVELGRINGTTKDLIVKLRFTN